jgi:hypothetical protein
LFFVMDEIAVAFAVLKPSNSPKGRKMTRYLIALTLLASTATMLQAQEGPTPTQVLIQVDSKAPVVPVAKDFTLKVDNRATPLTSIAPVPADGAQVALLIDDGLRVSIGRELDSLRSFVTQLRPGTEIFIGYMQNGRVLPAQDFTTNYAAAAKAIRIPQGAAGVSASPYFCLSDFVKRWPSKQETQVDLQQSASAVRKARFVLMLTSGVDPYNGSTSISNQSSPYVAAAVRDAQRAGVAVYSIYYGDAGIYGGRANFSGQSYLQQVSDETGGTAYYQGNGNPVSIEPYLKSFQSAVAESYIATFSAPGGKDLVNLNLKTNLPKTKVRAPRLVRPGNGLTMQAQ